MQKENALTNTVEATRTGRGLTLSRTFDATPEMVWKVWTDPIHVAKWWGPNGFTNTIHKMDVRKGGEWKFIMHGPDGRNYPNKIVFIEIKKPSLLVYKHSGDEDTEDVSFETKVTFENVNGKTKVTMKSVFESEEELERVVKEYGAIEGGKQTLSRLGEYLTTMNGGKGMEEKNELRIERVFNAPVELVWKAWSMPEHYKKWWGPEGFSAPVIKMDFRVGGKFLGCMRGPMQDGKEMDIWSTGTYTEIIPLKKIVTTDSFADEKGNAVPAEKYGMPADFPKEMQVIVTFEKMGNKTKMILRHVGMPKGEMTESARGGWNSSFDKLEKALLEEQ